MQIDFQERKMNCLQEQAVEVLYQEETAELIVPDVYPDVRAVVDASAVCCVRDQEIQPGSMTVSGAFQAAVLFTAEETGEVCVQELYLPFTAKLDRDGIGTESKGCTEVRIRSVDTRILNSRKILVRVSYAVRLTVYGPEDCCTWMPSGDHTAELLRSSVETLVPVAVGEKVSTLSEPIELPTMAAPVRRVAKAVPSLQTLEEKITDGRAIWRGILQMHLLCMLENGQLSSFDAQIPVAMFTDMGEEAEDGILRTQISFSEFQLEEDTPGSHLLTVGLRMQAVVCKKVMLELIEDGYCVDREFQPEYEKVRIRQLLDEPAVSHTVEAQIHGKVHRTVDCVAWVDFPVCRRGSDEISVGTVVTMHALYYDAEGNLCGETVRGEESSSFALCDGAVCYADAEPAGGCFLTSAGENSTIGCKVSVATRCFAEKTVHTMRTAEIGDEQAGKENRPSLIVCRSTGADRLWDVAKRSGSTVRAIREANGIDSDEITEQTLLLIPVI